MKNKCLLGSILLGAVLTTAQAEQAPTEKPQGYVERAQFTSGVENREPVDLVTVLENDQDQILFFSDIRQMSGRTVTHRWEYQGQVMAEVDFEVGGPRWRVHSSKTLLPDQLGKWSVVVVDQSGWPLHAEIFEYRQAAPQPVTAPAEPAVEEPLVSQPADEAMTGTEAVETQSQESAEEVDQVEAPQEPENLEIQGQ